MGTKDKIGKKVRIHLASPNAPIEGVVEGVVDGQAGKYFKIRTENDSLYYIFADGETEVEVLDA